ncbi:MAG TPA: DUF1624 domain-containing protein [Archaeoglobaceae archaeon]|nr:DUF1624 domain-containing protein [Archaeoglobaceae archaeon]
MKSVKEWKRLEFVDLVRGVAVILMVVYHVFFDLDYFNKISLDSPFWYFFPRFIGGMFIFVSGVSLSLARKKYGSRIYAVSLKRSVKYLLLGLLITIATIPTGCYVRFGILHFFGVAVVLGSFFSKFRLFSILSGILFVMAEFAVRNIRFDQEYLVWLGVMPDYFCTLDYYPILPWLGIMFFGIAFGNTSNLNFRIPDFLKPVTKLGRKSLAIYLLQHPVILFFMHLYYGDIFQQIVSMLG